MNAVLYLRFSSHAQNEFSIEGQRKECLEYAKRNNYSIVGEYVDRAISGKTDKRPDFQRMIEDSKKKHFEVIIVYQLDRFARSREDSAHYKAKLKKNGVRVISAREDISEDASGILMEAVLEGMAEYYSAELSQKIKRGMSLKRERCLYTGGTLTLGYKIRKEEVGKNGKGEILYDNYIELDPITAPIIRKIFEMYATGNTIVKINEHLNAQQFKTIRGGDFNKNSLRNILQNKRYIGIFTWKGGEIQDGIPRIVSDELFYKVQTIMSENKKAPARSRAREDYILTTKLFCGHCKEMMTGVSGTSKTGKIYNYYTCNKAKIKQCDKKQVSKKWIEDLVIAKCREILTDENIDIIAAAVVSAYEKSVDDTNLKRLQKLLKENEKSVDNLFKALEAGQVVEQITKRIQEKNLERAELEKQIATEEIASERLTEKDIKFFLTQLQKGDANDIRNRKAIITVFVNAVYLYDDKITFILNAGEKPIEITEQLLNEVENASEFVYGQLNTTKPPNVKFVGSKRIREKSEKLSGKSNSAACTLNSSFFTFNSSLNKFGFGYDPDKSTISTRSSGSRCYRVFYVIA